MSRKIFNYDDLTQSRVVPSLNAKSKLYTNTVSACGCLFYRIKSKKLQLLLIYYEDPNWPKLDDLGGQIDDSDDTIFDAIARETSEETNNVITKEYIMERFADKKDIEEFYNQQSKYYVVLMKVKKTFHPDTEVFGNFEKTDKIKREIKWADYETVKQNLAYRLLKNKKLMDYLDNLNNLSKKENSKENSKEKS